MSFYATNFDVLTRTIKYKFVQKMGRDSRVSDKWEQLPESGLATPTTFHTSEHVMVQDHNESSRRKARCDASIFDRNYTAFGNDF